MLSRPMTLDDTTEINLIAPRRILGQSSGVVPVALEPGLPRTQFQSAKTAKSSKIGSKSASKGSKSEGSESKGSKSKESKSKGSKSKGSKSKAAKSKSGKSKAAKSKAASKSVSAKSKAEKGKSAKSLYSSHESEDSFETKSVDDMEFDTETDNILPVPGESEESVAAAQSSSAELTSVHHGSVSSYEDSSTEEMEDIGNSRSDATATSSDGVEHDDGDVMSIESEDVIEPINLQGDSMEGNNNGNLDLEDDTQSSSNNFSPTDNNSSEEEIEDTSNASTEVTTPTPSSDTVDYDSESEDNVVGATNLKAAFIEERIEESEGVEILDEKEAILDPSRESLG